jgi:uncharacterized protein Smg (DUF494 family)
MLGLEVPNLDAGLSTEELQELASVFNKLSAYCVHKATAQKARLQGDAIAVALHYEQECEKLYQQLPRDIRW